MNTFTIQDLAGIAGRTSETVRAHIKDGYLKAEKFAGARGWRISRKEAEKWLGKFYGKRLPS